MSAFTQSGHLGEQRRATLNGGPAEVGLSYCGFGCAGLTNMHLHPAMNRCSWNGQPLFRVEQRCDTRRLLETESTCMANKIGLTLVTAGCLLAAIVLFFAGASSAAQARTGTSTEFSAQQQQENKGQQKKAAPAARPAPQRALRNERLRSVRPRSERLRKGRLHVRLPRAVRNSVWSLRRRRLRAWLHRAGRHQARLLGRKPLRAWSDSRSLRRKW